MLKYSNFNLIKNNNLFLIVFIIFCANRQIEVIANPNATKTECILYQNNNLIKNHELDQTLCPPYPIKQIKKKLTLMFYSASDNDLHPFAWPTIKQLANGANENVHIIVQLNEPGRNKKTQRYLIEKNKAKLLNPDGQQKLDSGDPHTLIDFCTWAIKNFPADDYLLDLSDHGSGIIDRNAARLINPAELFVLNPSNLMLELDRSIEFLDFLEKPKKDMSQEKYRGICFDETYQSYLTNQKLEFALQAICKEATQFLDNKKPFKFSILGMDACLMQMLEFEYLSKFAHILVASQEVELAWGWRYDKILKPMEYQTLNYTELAKHIVKVYQETYSGITNDFTLSAINLDIIDQLKNNVNKFSELLIEMLQNQKDNSVKIIIKKCKSSIAFEEPSYIDLRSFYENINKNLDKLYFKNPESENLKTQLSQTIKEGLDILQEIVIENTSGRNISYAKGLSIYFPEKRIHNSYNKTNFAQTNQWLTFLMHYVAI